MTYNQFRYALETASRMECEQAGLNVRWRERDHPHHRMSDIMARLRSGVRISYDGTDYRVHDEWNHIVMMTADPSKALNRYFFQCSVAEQQAELARRSDCLGLTPAAGKW